MKYTYIIEYSSLWDDWAFIITGDGYTSIRAGFETEEEACDEARKEIERLTNEKTRRSDKGRKD